MSFTGPNPYGTAGGDENIAAPQTPPVIRTGLGNSVILFLHVNGRLVERLRENVEDVVRILGLSGQVLVAIITRENGVVRDANTSDMDFQYAFSVTQIAPGVVTVEIGNDAITSAMLQDALIQAIHLAPLSVTNPALGDDSVDARVIAPGTITDVELAPGLIPKSWVLLDEDTFAAAATYHGQANLFSATYDDYVIDVSNISITGNGELQIQQRAGGVTQSAGGWYGGGVYLSSASGGSSGGFAVVNQNAGKLMIAGGATHTRLSGQIHVYKPKIAQPTTVVSHLVSYASAVPATLTQSAGEVQNANYAADTFTLLPTLGNISGTVRVYGKVNTP